MERNLADFFDGGDIMEPQILQITLIFNKLQILQIVQIDFFRTADFADEADFTQIGFLDAQAHEFLRIGWRKMFLETNLS